MKRNVSLEEISDGRLYRANDMVRADCRGCQGCSECCHGMGESIILDPYDAWRLTTGLAVPFAALLQEKVELNVVDGVILPNLRMDAQTEACGFLDADGRCSIHAYRPGICRLFPLGRYYLPEKETELSGEQERAGQAALSGEQERAGQAALSGEQEKAGQAKSSGMQELRYTGEFRYFLQVHECPMPNKSKVKVGRWIDTPQLQQYEAYIRRWHSFLEALEQKLPAWDDEQVKNVNVALLKLLFLKPYEAGDFYPQFEERMRMAEGLTRIL